MQNLLPEVYLHLKKHSLQIEFFSYQWYLTLFSYDFTLDFFCLFLFAFQCLGQPLFIQLALALIEDMAAELLAIRESESILAFIKEYKVQGREAAVFTRALTGFSVTAQRMSELEEIWRNSKQKQRVLFFKDSQTATDRTQLKALPSLPDDSEYNMSQLTTPDRGLSGRTDTEANIVSSGSPGRVITRKHNVPVSTITLTIPVCERSPRKQQIKFEQPRAMGERPIARDPQQLFADRDASAFQSPAGTGRSLTLNSVMQERRINNPLTSLTRHLPVDENLGAIRKKLSSTQRAPLAYLQPGSLRQQRALKPALHTGDR